MEPENIPVEASVVSDPDPSTLTINQIGTLQTLTKHNLQQHLDNALAFAEFSKKIRIMCLDTTSPIDWHLMGDKPYLLDSGVNKVLGLIGASISNVSTITQTEYEDELGRVDHYTTTGTIHFNGKSFTNIGMASTKDKFFAERKGKFLKFEDVDKANCKKKSVTNLNHRLLNMAMQFNPTKEELAAKFGEGFGKITSNTYGKGSKGGTVDSAEETKLRTEIGNVLIKLCDGEKEQAKLKLQEITSFGDGEKAFAGYTDLKKVSSKMLKSTLTKAKKLAEDEQKAIEEESK